MGATEDFRLQRFCLFSPFFWNQSANGNQIAGNNHWMADFLSCDFDADRIFNMAIFKGHTFAWDPMKKIIALFGNNLTEYCNIKPSHRYRLLRASSFFSLTFHSFTHVSHTNISLIILKRSWSLHYELDF